MPPRETMAWSEWIQRRLNASFRENLYVAALAQRGDGKDIAELLKDADG